MKEIKLTYFIHTTIGKENNDYFIKDVLYNYFDGMSNKIKTTIVGVYEEKKYFHNIKIENSNINKSFINRKENKNLLYKIKHTTNEIKKCDICFIFMPSYSSILAALICLLLKKKYVIYFGSNWYDLEKSKPNGNSLKAYFFKRISNFLCNKSIFSLHTGRSILNSHKGKVKYLTIPIINFTEELLYDKSEITPLNSKPTINLLFVGALTKNKGVNILIDAIKELKYSNIRLNIVGNGPEYQALISQVNELKLNEKVFFLGYMNNGSELFDIYKKSDIFILPSYSEGFPRVLYEAAGSSCAIITTPVNSIPDILYHGEDCLFVKPGNKNDIVDSINNLIENNDLNIKLIKNAFKKIKSIIREKAYDQHYNLISRHI